MKIRQCQMLATVSLWALAATQITPSLAQTAQQTPSAAMKAEMKEADKDMGRVLQKLQSLGAKPLSTLSVEQARSQPTPADAVKGLLKDEGKDPDQLMAAMKVGKKDMTYPTEGGTQPIRIYTPEGSPAQGGLPVIVYIHGGGWVIADINTYEASAMALAKKANAIVASIEYRHAPEAKFPAAHEDANAAYKWVAENAASWGGDPQKLALVGESAGGNLALNVAIAAREQQMTMPLAIVAVYPVAGVDTNTQSYKQHAKAAPLGKEDMEWFFDKVLSKPDDKQDARLDLVGKADFKGLPPTTVITAEIDPLMSEGKAVADKLKQAGVRTTYENFDGVSHEFFGMGLVVKDADRAEDLAAKNLKAAFSSSGDARSK